jgi:hypothetical protein
MAVTPLQHWRIEPARRATLVACGAFFASSSPASPARPGRPEVIQYARLEMIRVVPKCVL